MYRMYGQIIAPAISALPPSVVVVLGQRICTGCTVLGQRRSSCRGAIAEEQKPALRVMVVANCARFTSLAVNEAAVYLAKLLKGHAKHS